MKLSLIFVLTSILAAFLPFKLSHAAEKVETPQHKLLNQKIDLNKADIHILEKSIKGIGKKRAEAIIKYRETQGPFTSLRALAKVPGLGEKFVTTHWAEIQQIFVAP